jgi:hypothetical protein
LQALADQPAPRLRTIPRRSPPSLTQLCPTMLLTAAFET